MNKVILPLLSFMIFISCGGKTVNPEEIKKEDIKEQKTDTIQQEDTLTKDEVILYFETFRELLLNGKIEELADLIHFPVEGDYSWEQVNDKGELKRDFNPYRKREDFIKNHSKLFGEDMTNLLKKVDFKESLNKDYRVTITKEPNTELSFTVGFIDWFKPEREQEPTEVNFEIDRKEIGSTIGGKGIIYRFSKIDKKIRLTAIQFVG